MTGLRLGILTLLLGLLNATAWATTYYVSSSTGSDLNSGTSSTVPWQTIARVNAQSFLPGDSILFKRGDVWNESLAPAASGSSGNPITFDAYGTGPAPNLTGYYAVPATAWVPVTGNAWKAPVPATYTTVNFCLFGSIWGQKVAAVSSNLTAQWDFYLANGFVYVYSVGSPATYYSGAIVPMALSNVPVININGQSWLAFQHFLVNWFDQYGVYVQGASDHLVFANMEADSMIPQGTQPLGFYVDESAPGPGDIKIYDAEAHLNYDGFRFDGAAAAITMVNDKAYGNRDGALVDNTGAVSYSYCHFYASSLAVAGSTDVEWTTGTGPTAGAGNIAQDTAPAVQAYQRYPAEVTLTVDDSGMTAGADTYYASTVLPIADAAGVPVGAAITVGYPLAQTLIAEFQGWVNAGRDVTSHSISHTYYTNTDSLEIQYTGSGTTATLSISDKTLTITVTGAADGVSYNLAQGQAQGTIRAVRLALLATGKFTATEATPCQGPYGTGCSAYTESALLAQDLADVSGQDVETSIYHMQLNVTRLTTDEINLSRQWMTTNLTGLPATPVYVYPGGYETTAMQGITEVVPYSGARGALKEDLGVKDTYADGFNVQNVTSFGVNPSWMGLAPAVLNQKIQALVWKESVWGAPWGIFWHLNELTNDDPVGGTEITNLIQDFKASGATIRTNTGLVNWLLSGTQEVGTDGNYYYTFPATSMTLDFRPTKNSPVVDAGQNLGTAYALDINGVNQNSYGSGWEIGAHVYEAYAMWGLNESGYHFMVGQGAAGADQYVSPLGSDSYDGSEPVFTSGSHGPVADVCSAKAKVAGLVGTKAVVVMVEDGTLQGQKTSYVGGVACRYPIAFAATDGGTNSSDTVTYENYPGESPVFDGGQQVTGWSVSSAGLCAGLTNCYSVSLSPSSWNYFEGLFYNGARRFRPRMGAGLAFPLVSATVSGSGNQANVTYVTSGGAPVLASSVTIAGSTGGTGFNTTCNVSATTSNSFTCGVPNAAGTATGGSAIVGNQGEYYRVATGCTGACDTYNYATGDPIGGTCSNLSVSNPGTGNPTNDLEDWDFQAWSVSVLRIASINTGTQLVTATGNVGTNPAGEGTSAFTTGHRLIHENCREQFGQPGQWFLDRNTAPNWTLYYRLQPGDTNPNADTVIVPQVPQASGMAPLFTFNNTQFFITTGLTFEHDDTIVPQSSYNDQQLNPNMVPLFYCFGCQNFAVTNSTFTETMGAAMQFAWSGTVPACCITVTGNQFYDIGANAVKIGVATNTLAEANVPTNLTVSNNYLAYGGRVYPGASGITSGLVNHLIASNNSIHDWYQKGIETGKPQIGSSSNNSVHDSSFSNNDIWNLSMSVTDDLGGIYLVDDFASGTLGAGANNTFTHNRVRDVTDPGPTGGNIDPDGYGATGLYEDSHSGAITATNNLVFRTSGVNLNMTYGPDTTGIPNVWQNNISSNAVLALIGALGCSPSGTALQFNVLSNLFYSNNTTATVQKLQGIYYGAALPTAVQNWANNQYFNSAENWSTLSSFMRYATGESDASGNWLCSGFEPLSFAQWASTPVIPGTTGNEDAGSLISNPNFVQPFCTLATADACAADPTQDNYSAVGTAGLSPVPLGGSAIPLTGFGATTGFGIPVVADTFPILPLNPSIPPGP
jgi:hypothetical protein